jgi:CDP-diacylglycerol--glycerol-3-phosphate 3-phosphatidyltransferase
MSSSLIDRNVIALVELHRQWRQFAVLNAALLIVGYLAVALHWSFAHAQLWAAVAAPASLYALWLLRRGLPNNYRPSDQQLLNRLGAGNVLTILRGLAIALLAGFLLIPRPDGLLAWVPGLLYIAAITADYFDGYLARITNQATALGADLDMEFDALGMLTVTLLASLYGQVPVWYVAVGLARYLFVVGLWQRRRRGLPLHPIPPSAQRRINAGLQMGFMGIILLPVFAPPATTLAAPIFAAALFASFARDWLVVSGRLDPQTDAYQRWRERLGRWMFHWLPLPLRALAVGAAVSLVLADVAWWPVAAAAGSLALGAAGRLGAAALALCAAAGIQATGLTTTNGLALVASILLLYLGSGACTAWRPEDRWLTRRAGE